MSVLGGRYIRIRFGGDRVRDPSSFCVVFRLPRLGFAATRVIGSLFSAYALKFLAVIIG